MNNAIFSLMSTVIRVFTNLGIVSIYSHSLSLNLFSYFALGLFIAQIICIFIDAGVNMEIMRFARIEEKNTSLERLANSTIVRLSLGLFLSLIILLTYFFSGSKYIEISILIFSILSGIITSICESYYINIKAKNDFKLEFKMIIIQSIFVVITALASFKSEWIVLLSLLIPRLVMLYWLAIKQAKLFLYVNKITFSTYYNYFYRLKYYSLDAILSNINFQMDNILVVSVLGRELYGLYQPLSRLNNSAISLVSAVASFIVPLASAEINEKKKWYLLQSAFLAFGILCCLGFFTFSSFIIETFFNPAYIHDSKLILLLSLVIIVRCFCAGSGSYLTLIGLQKFRALSNSVFTIISVLIGYSYSYSIEDILKIVLCTQFAMSIVYFTCGLLNLKNRLIK